MASRLDEIPTQVCGLDYIERCYLELPLISSAIQPMRHVRKRLPDALPACEIGSR